MVEYLSPGIKIEDMPSGAKPIQIVGASTGGMVGITPRGNLDKPLLVTSWTDYINKYAYGMDSPFQKDSDLSYCVYAFFANGGGMLYIKRVDGANAKKASATVAGATFNAADEGDWGNNVSVTIILNEDNEELVDVIVSYKGTTVENFTGLIPTPDTEIEENLYFVDAINAYMGGSKYIAAVDGETIDTTALPTTPTVLTGGANDYASLTDADYLGPNGLASFDPIDDVTLLAIPSQTSDAVLKGLISYCGNRKDTFAILDAPSGLDTVEVKAVRKKLSGKESELHTPWVTVTDPLSRTNKLRLVPSCGHIMGIYARTIAGRGVHVAPAGTEALLRGAVGMERHLTEGDSAILNPVNVNCIMDRPNYGIVMWGARTLSPDSAYRYVSSVLLNIVIKKSVMLGTQFAVFQPNDPQLWLSIRATIEAFLYTLWQGGALFGKTAAEAYYVKCDEELNPEEVRLQGICNVEVGYADKKPAEFVVIKFGQKTAASA